MPVSPIPPAVAQKTSGFSVGVTVRTSPDPVRRVSECTWLPKVPSTWWLLPWMSDAIAPPDGDERVPGVTGTNQPRGMSHRISESRLVPAPTVTIPRSRSMVLTPVSAVASSTIPPAFCAASP